MATTMTTTDVLDVLKQKIGQAVADIDGTLPDYEDDFLLSYVKTVGFELTVLGIDPGITVDTTNGLSAEVSIPIGMLLAIGAAADLVGDDLLVKLKSGQLGLSFRTALAEVTTNQAAIILNSSSLGLSRLYNLMITAYLSGDPNSVLIRAQ